MGISLLVDAANITLFGPNIQFKFLTAQDFQQPHFHAHN